MPNELAKLVQPGLTDQGSLAHPSIMDNADTKQMIKMLKFKLWAENKVKTSAFKSVSEVLKAEVKKFESHGFTKRADFQVTYPINYLQHYKPTRYTISN